MSELPHCRVDGALWESHILQETGHRPPDGFAPVTTLMPKDGSQSMSVKCTTMHDFRTTFLAIVVCDHYASILPLMTARRALGQEMLLAVGGKSMSSTTATAPVLGRAQQW